MPASKRYISYLYLYYVKRLMSTECARGAYGIIRVSTLRRYRLLRDFKKYVLGFIMSIRPLLKNK